MGLPARRYEQRIPQDLYAAEKKVKSQIEDLLGKLTENSENANVMENNISAIKDYASDLQAYLGSKMMDTEIQKLEMFLQSLFDDGSLRKIHINCKIDDKITDGIISSSDSIPVDCSCINDNTVAVSFRYSKQIQFITFQLKELNAQYKRPVVIAVYVTQMAVCCTVILAEVLRK
ncbi:Hypothetical predicted protein [Mytilus galloprovincialis]|uniref:Uncharacterized protein n=1 Tax=Mytilus galloprovincialis TaxID=29158 RepID=A0A8B6EZ81_MYTGA|nr:Hypothetical predicted protein [Mytilus galloprovincialis]